jgi:hypothetical protein
MDGKKTFFAFTVLPFWLGASAFYFQQIFRSLMEKWGAQGIQAWLYLDDGLVVAPDYESWSRAVAVVRGDLRRAGVCESREKCVWEPAQLITWLGIIIDLKSYSLL